MVRQSESPTHAWKCDILRLKHFSQLSVRIFSLLPHPRLPVASFRPTIDKESLCVPVDGQPPLRRSQLILLTKDGFQRPSAKKSCCKWSAIDDRKTALYVLPVPEARTSLGIVVPRPSPAFPDHRDAYSVGSPIVLFRDPQEEKKGESCWWALF